jgi:hypothetical protein
MILNSVQCHLYMLAIDEILHSNYSIDSIIGEFNNYSMSITNNWMSSVEATLKFNAVSFHKTGQCS